MPRNLSLLIVACLLSALAWTPATAVPASAPPPATASLPEPVPVVARTLPQAVTSATAPPEKRRGKAPGNSPGPVTESPRKLAVQRPGKPVVQAATARYSGTSRFWYPALGIKAAWKWYGCAYGGSPRGLGAGVYRWGCAPKVNVYLMSHVWSTFKAVRRGFHSGRMKVGQSVWYANEQGKVSRWKVKWIDRVGVDYFRATHAKWAANDSARPIMTLQTCDGRRDQFRIIVRLVPAS